MLHGQCWTEVLSAAEPALVSLCPWLSVLVLALVCSLNLAVHWNHALKKYQFLGLKSQWSWFNWPGVKCGHGELLKVMLMCSGLPTWLSGKESSNAEDTRDADAGSIPGLGRSSGGGHGHPLRYSCLENPHGQRSLAGCIPWGVKRVGHDWVTKHSTAHHNYK